MKFIKSIILGIIMGAFSVNALQASPIVIAHRGASGYLPEHTLESATLAYAQGADYIEQDLVATRDSQLIVLHDIHLDTVTNVEEKFPTRKREDGRYYAIDFTLAEIKSLRVFERKDSEGNQVFKNRYQGKGHFQIATFEEQIELIQQLNRQFAKNTGLYTEIKSPAWHQEQGVDISQLTMNILRKHQLDDPNKAVYIQCFDFLETKRIRNALGAKVKLIQLIAENDWLESTSDYDYLKTPAGLKEISQVAQGIGPWIPQLLDFDQKQATALTKLAHNEGLAVHPYTFRKDALPANISTQEALDLLFKEAQVDGIFTDFTDTVIDYLSH
ncbi:glycerophosphodiester phosphodiesterase [Paraglaciecola sp. 2405UD69-4]|uniref:glycerophosphodiester phosphodiesterase n=1 Tax=Paraglaciecola sp. 2405UD69-4 TaxID=3391836 RepID=UPI0039C9B21B